MADKEVFEVARRLTKVLGWFFVVVGLGSFGLFFLEWSPPLLIVGLILPIYGVQFVLSAGNVNKIIVDKHSIKFLPVGAEFRFSEAEKMEVPSWADRFDTPPNMLTHLTVETNTEKTRYVPGAILQWNNGCRLNVHGCDGNKMLRALRQHIPE